MLCNSLTCRDPSNNLARLCSRPKWITSASGHSTAAAYLFTNLTVQYWLGTHPTSIPISQSNWHHSTFHSLCPLWIALQIICPESRCPQRFCSHRRVGTSGLRFGRQGCQVHMTEFLNTCSGMALCVISRHSVKLTLSLLAAVDGWMALASQSSNCYHQGAF